MNKSPSRNISFFYTKTIRLIHLTVQEAVAVDVYLGWMKEGCVREGNREYLGWMKEGCVREGNREYLGWM